MNAHAAPAVVLVADDEPTMLELVSGHLRSLENMDLEVLEASDGDQAWDIVRKRQPDLVVLDVMMPGMSGWELCRRIRQDSSLDHTGVVMLTGIGDTLNETTSPLFGADEYIDKPFEFPTLEAKVASALAKRSSQRKAVPRSAGNGVSGPAMAVASVRSTKKSSKRVAKKAKPAAVPAKKKHVTKFKKGTKTMAAKKGAKKAAKKVAKKAAKKGAKKAKKAAKK